MSLKSKTINGLKWASLSTIITSVVKMLQLVILTRFLSKADFGLVAIALLFISFSNMFLDMGLTAAVLHKKNITKKQFSSLYWFNIFTGVLIYLVLFFATPLISNFYKQTELLKIIPLTSLIIVISSFSLLHRTVQQKNMNFKFIGIVDISASIVMLVLTVILVYLNYGIYSLIYSTIFNSFFIAIIYTVFALLRKDIKFYFNIRELIPFLKIGIFQLGSTILDFFSRELDVIIIGSFFSMEMLGGYSLCKQLTLRVFTVINPIMMKVVTPMFSIIQNEKEIIKEKYKQIIQLLSFINFPIYTLIALLATQILSILYGEQYSSFNIVLMILSFNYAILSIGNPVGSLQVALGRTDLGFYWTMYRIVAAALFMYVGTFFSFNIFILFILLNNTFNIFPSVKILLKKLINIRYTEYIALFATPLFICVSIVIIFYFIYLNLNYYLEVAVISSSFIVLYITSSFLLNKKIFVYTFNIIRDNFKIH